MKQATPTPHRLPSDAGHHDEPAAPEPSIPGSYEAFKALCAEFLRAADTADAEELESGAKCVGLAYLGIHWDDANPFHKIHRAAGAPALMRIVTRKVIERELVIEQADPAELMRCAP